MVAIAPCTYIKFLRWLPVEINEQTKTELYSFRYTLTTLAGFIRMPHSAFSNLLVCLANNDYLFILLSHVTQYKFHVVSC